MIYYIRKEYFGATVYEPAACRYFFLFKEQLEILNTPFNYQDNHKIDLSNGRFAELIKNIHNDDAILIWKTSSDPLPIESLSAPISVYFEITRLCNGNCVYCLNNSGQALDNPLTTGEMCKIIDNLAIDGVFEVRLTGGEITLFPDYQLIARQVIKNNMSLVLNSNLLCNIEILNNLINLRPNLLVTSLDALKVSHRKQRGHGYEKIVKNIKEVLENKIPVRINCMLTPYTIPHIEKFIDNFAPMGCDFSFMLPRPSGRAINNGKIMPSIKLFSEINQLIVNKSKQYSKNNFFSSFVCVMEQELTIGSVELTGCSAIQKSFNINSDGSVYPCAFCEFDANYFNLGNVRDLDYSISKIWKDSHQLKNLRKQSAKVNMRCIHCNEFKKNCMGSCIIMKLYEGFTGNPDPYCKKSIEKSNCC